MKTDIIIPISKDPELGLDRKATVSDFHWSTRNKTITVDLGIEFIDDKGSYLKKKRIHNYSVSLVADNTTYVDANGDILPVDYEFAESEEKVTEYEFFMTLAQGKIDMFQLIEAAILKADARKRFDE